MNSYVGGFQGGRGVSGQNPMNKIDGFNRRFDTRQGIPDMHDERLMEELEGDKGLDEGIWDISPLEIENIVNEKFPFPMGKRGLPPKNPLKQDISSRSIPKVNEVENKREKRGIELPLRVARSLAILTLGTSLILSACKPKNTQVSTSEPTSEIPISEPIDPDLLSSTPTATKEPTPKPTSTATKEPTPTPTVRPIPYAFSYDEESIYREDENTPLIAVYAANIGEEDQRVVVRHHVGSSSLRNYTSGQRIEMIKSDLAYVTSQTGIDTEVTEEELKYMQQILLEFAPYKEFYYYRGEDDFMCILPQGLTGVYFVEPNGSVTIVRTFAELLKMGLSDEIMDQVYDENYIFLEKDGEYMPVCKHLSDILDSGDDG